MTDTRKLLELKEIKDILSAYKAVLDEESKNYKNAITLYKKEIISKNELSSKENLYRKAKSEYDNREATYRRILWEFDNLNIKAPFDGTINKYYYDVGQKILKGQQLIQFSNYSKLIGKVSLKSEDIKNIQINRSTINIVNSDSEIEILGTSKEIDKSVFSYLLEFKLNNENKKFLPGEVVEVEIETEAFENYLIFPSKAVININNKFYVFIYDNGYAYKIEIEPNWVDNENCAIENFDDYNELFEEAFEYLATTKPSRLNQLLHNSLSNTHGPPLLTMDMNSRIQTLRQLIRIYSTKDFDILLRFVKIYTYEQWDDIVSDIIVVLAEWIVCWRNGARQSTEKLIPWMIRYCVNIFDFEGIHYLYWCTSKGEYGEELLTPTDIENPIEEIRSLLNAYSQFTNEGKQPINVINQEKFIHDYMKRKPAVQQFFAKDDDRVLFFVNLLKLYHTIAKFEREGLPDVDDVIPRMSKEDSLALQRSVEKEILMIESEVFQRIDYDNNRHPIEIFTKDKHRLADFLVGSHEKELMNRDYSELTVPFVYETNSKGDIVCYRVESNEKEFHTKIKMGITLALRSLFEPKFIRELKIFRIEEGNEAEAETEEEEEDKDSTTTNSY